jgi:single-strand DNA-binding protein
MLNKVMFIGYAGADAEMKFTASGIPVANFSLAVNDTYKTGNGEKKTNTLWIRCVAWRRWAEIVGEFVNKGKFLYVEGRLQQRSYEDRDGKKRDVTEVIVGMLKLLGPAKNGNGSPSAQPSEAPKESENPFNEAAGEEPDPDIPF